MHQIDLAAGVQCIEVFVTGIAASELAFQRLLQPLPTAARLVERNVSLCEPPEAHRGCRLDTLPRERCAFCCSVIYIWSSVFPLRHAVNGFPPMDQADPIMQCLHVRDSPFASTHIGRYSRKASRPRGRQIHLITAFRTGGPLSPG